jgi:CBS domain-containing protein
MAPIPASASSAPVAASTATLTAATAAFLRRHVPFDRMDAAHVDALAAAAKIRYYAPGETLLAPESGVVTQALVIQRGRVERRAPAALGQSSASTGATIEAEEPLQTGEVFPITAVLDQRAVVYTYRAIGDVFCYEIPADLFRRIVPDSPVLRAFCTQRLRAMLELSRAALQSHYAEQASAEQSMATSLESLLRRAPLSCAPATPVAEVLETMRRERIGSIVIVDGEARPVGIFTERDVVDRAARGLLDRTALIEALMTAPVRTLPHTATLGDAALEMARHGSRHAVVTRDGRLAGVVSQRDLFAVQRVSFFRVSQAIDGAADLDALVAASSDIRALARNLLAQGVAAEALTQFVSELNDHVVRRAIELERVRNEGANIDDIAFAWIALGSEGRGEQTFSTDQDNGIVFVAPEHTDSESARARLLAFARRVNAALDRCGFPLCKGEIMASNPQWCLTVEEWRTRFGDWLRNPVPQALLAANIFFDFRSITRAGGSRVGAAGTHSHSHAASGASADADTPPAATADFAAEPFVADLRAWLADAAPHQRSFLLMMAKNALETRPPLGWFGGLVGTTFASRDTQLPADAIDLKLQGVRLFTDAARILALAHGVAQTGTAARLRAVAERGALPASEADAAVDAFHYLQQLRLRLQFGDPAAVPGAPNAVLPDKLNELDRRILKEAFIQARRLQQRLGLDYAG